MKPRVFNRKETNLNTTTIKTTNKWPSYKFPSMKYCIQVCLNNFVLIKYQVCLINFHFASCQRRTGKRRRTRRRTPPAWPPPPSCGRRARPTPPSSSSGSCCPAASWPRASPAASPAPRRRSARRLRFPASWVRPAAGCQRVWGAGTPRRTCEFWSRPRNSKLLGISNICTWLLLPGTRSNHRWFSF